MGGGGREAAPKFEVYDRFAEGEGGVPSSSPSRRASFTERIRTRSGAAKNSRKRRCRIATEKSARKGGVRGVRGGRNGRGGPGDIVENQRHPHFFHGLAPNARRLITETYTENRSRLLALGSHERREHGGSVEASNTAPLADSSLPSIVVKQSSDISPPCSPSQCPANSRSAKNTVRQAANAFAAAGQPPDIDAAVLDRHSSLLSRLAEAATRIQRARRARALPRAARRLWRRQRAALAIQRCFRALLGRNYAELWKVVANMAATKISTAWRRFVARRAYFVLRARALAAIRSMQVNINFLGHAFAPVLGCTFGITLKIPDENRCVVHGFVASTLG